MCYRSLLLLLTSVALSCLVFAQEEPSPRQSSDAATSSPSPQAVTLPDGSPIFLRFAQPVYGLMAAPKRVAIHKGATVRLVAGADVRTNGRIIIAKGAIAQATVTNVLPHGATLSNNGLTLRLDWVETIIGARVALRPERVGDPVPFTVRIYSTSGGIEVVPHVNTRGRMLADAGKLVAGWYLVDPKSYRREKTWIPAGSRLHVFLHGDLTVSMEELEEAQADLPVPNLTATLYVFRTKDHTGRSPAISCDQGEARLLGSQQSVAFDLEAGQHSCKVGTSPTIEFTVEAGNDYFLRLQQAGSTWKLAQVAGEEGEDRVAGCELLPPLTSESNPK